MFKKITVPFRRFAHVDLVGPLPPSHGYTYFLTCIDRSTCWPEVIHRVWISAAEYASAMFHGWISRFGVPTIITSDRGNQFTSSLWSAICSLLNIRQNLTTTFHLQSKGIIERFHRQLKKFSMISPGLLRLVWALTLDSVRFTCCTKRGFCHISLRSCIWFWFSPTSSVSGSSRSAF